MKKVIVGLFCVALLSNVYAFAATDGATFKKVLDPRIVRATKDTSLTYGGVKIFVPAGQTLILGQSSDGSVIVRGENLDGVKINEGSVSVKGIAVISAHPKSDVLSIIQGDNVLVTDANGRTAALSRGAAVSMSDIRENVAALPSDTAVTKAQLNNPNYTITSQKTAPAATDNDSAFSDDIPDFVAESAITSAASEQATWDVQETETVLSPSAPR